MKLILSALVYLMCLPAFGAWSEVECSGQSEQGPLMVTVEEGFGPTTFRRALVQLDNVHRNFTVMSRGAFGNRVRYEAAGFHLEVDFWPDARPQWARTYRGNFAGTDLNIPFTMLWCRFPNIRP